VLGKAPEDAVFMFAPAGVGMLLATTLLGRFGYRVRKEWLRNVGLIMLGLGFTALGLITQGYRILPEPLLRLYPHAAFSLTSGVMFISLLMGLTMSGVSILGQTTLQEASPPGVRGRVFALQFMLNNLIGIPPMLTIGGLADWVGIPQVMLGMGVVVLAAAAASIYFTLSPARRRSIGQIPHRVAVAGKQAGDWLADFGKRPSIRQIPRRVALAGKQAGNWLTGVSKLTGQMARTWYQAWLVFCVRVVGFTSRQKAMTGSPSSAGKGEGGAQKSSGAVSERHPEDRGDK